MLNKYFREYKKQKSAFLEAEDTEIERTKKLRKLSKNESVLRDRILRTFKKDRHSIYNFTAEELRKELILKNAILPTVITQNEFGDFILLFSSDNHLIAFKEAFSNGIAVNGTTVLFGKVRFEHLSTAITSMKTLINRRKKEKSKNRKVKIHSLFPRNLDDSIHNLGGLLQSSHQCMIPLNEVLHNNWCQSELQSFDFKPHSSTLQSIVDSTMAIDNDSIDGNDSDMDTDIVNAFLDDSNSQESKAKSTPKVAISNLPNSETYAMGISTMNGDIWQWYHNHIPTEAYLTKLKMNLEYLLSLVHKTLAIPNNNATNMPKMFNIFGSLSYGLFYSPHCDIDIGVLLNTNIASDSKKDENRSNVENASRHKAAKFLQLLCRKIKTVEKQYCSNWRKFRTESSTKEVLSKTALRTDIRRVVVKEARLTARIPILRLYLPQSKVDIDISVSNNSNFVSRLIMAFVKCDVRVRPYLMALKYWAYQRAINKAVNGYLNSFGWVLLGIKYLQLIENPILPIMKLDRSNGAVLLKENIDASLNGSTVAELLTGFFHYFATFQFDKYQISITNDGLIEKNQSQFKLKKNQNVWLVEHPMIDSINVSNSVRKWNAFLIKDELERAAKLSLACDWNQLTLKQKEKKFGSNSDPKLKYNCLLISNLRYDVTQKHLRTLLSKVAKPVSIALVEFESGKHNGKAYVAFGTATEAHSVMAEHNGSLLLGRPLIMRFTPTELIEAAMSDEAMVKKQRKTNKKLRKEVNQNGDKPSVLRQILMSKYRARIKGVYRGGGNQKKGKFSRKKKTQKFVRKLKKPQSDSKNAAAKSDPTVDVRPSDYVGGLLLD